MQGRPNFLRTVLGEPLVRFFALGAAIFAVYLALAPAREAGPPPDAIVVSADDARRLAESFRATWRRPPTPQELAGLIDDRVIEEAMVREARALGLDRGDAVVRQRLRQKMAFFAEAGAGTEEPDEPTLRAHFEAHRERFERPPRIAFEQVFLGTDPAPAALDDARAALVAGTDPRTLGERTLLPAALAPAPPTAVDGTFGPGFFERLETLAPGGWEGPVPSAYGAHLVRVTARDVSKTRFEDVRADVERDWRSTRAVELREAFAEALVARYRIERPDPASVLAP